MVSCSSNPPAAAQATEGKKEQPTQAKITPAQTAKKRNVLSEDQFARIREVQKTFVHVDGLPLQKYVDDFERADDVEAELKVWERMATAYTKYTEKRKLSGSAKREVFTVLLLRSAGTEKEAIENAGLKTLTADQAREVLKLF